MAGQVQSASSGVTAGAQLIPNLPAGGRMGYLHLVQVAALGGGTGVLTLYDAVGSAANQIFELTVPTTWSDRYDFDGELTFKNGLWAVVTGTGAIARVTWE